MGMNGDDVGVVTFLSDEVVLKPPNDRRLYRFIRLSNGLEALLIHDPQIYPDGPPSQPLNEDDDANDQQHEQEGGEGEGGGGGGEEGEEDGEGNEDGANGAPQTKKAAAAMWVGIGSFSDPLEAQGLAHFLEHMLFMGSEEFPDENEFDKYMSKHGGSSNAYTETEHTCYHFEVSREYLKGALRRFSQFFVSPLVKMGAVEREVLAVDSGNKKSLVGAMEKGINLREQILKLYEDYYRGGLMKLVIIGGESLDVLESWVVELFGAVRKGPQVNPKFTAEGPIWKSGKIYRLEAVKDVHILDLSWTLPCLHQEYLKKPEVYIGHVLRHEGRGSLFSFLKAKGWAMYLDAGVEYDGISRSTTAYIFVMSIYLTDCGMEKIFDIIGFVYQYLKLLRQVSPQEWIFKELQNIGNMDFRFAEENPQDEYASNLAVNLNFYPAEHVIYGDYVYKTWDEQLIDQLLGFFIPDNMRVDVVSKSIPESEDFQYEPWFDSRYVEEDIAQNLMELWRDPPEIDASLHLPSKNEFIPSDFSVRADGTCNDDFANSTYPRCIVDEALMKFWYKLDSTFKVPRASTYFQINFKGGYDDSKASVLFNLFIHLLNDELSEIIYQAGIANLDTSVSCVGDKLELRVDGFNEKLPILLSNVLAVARSFMPTDDRFKVIKENMKRNLRNANMKPLGHATYLRLQVLFESFYDVDENLHYLNDLHLDDLKAFIPELRSQRSNIDVVNTASEQLAPQCVVPVLKIHTRQAFVICLKLVVTLFRIYIEGLCHGNLSEAEAISISDIFKINFPVNALPVELRHVEHVICLPPSANLVRDAIVKNKSEKNSVVELYFQIEEDLGVESIKLRALNDLFGDIVREPFFDQLRTKEQLGYVVGCGARTTCHAFGIVFCVQSSEYDPVYLQGRIDNFINGLEELLDGLDDDSFDKYKTSLMAKLLEKPPSLTYEAHRYWSQITENRFIFDLSNKEAEELKNISKHDIVEWGKTYFKPSSPKCRRLLVRLWGCNTEFKDAEALPESEQPITDVVAFKTSCKVYSKPLST